MNITHGLQRALQINQGGLARVYGGRRRSGLRPIQKACPNWLLLDFS
jgi:hypothetical protein